MADRTVAQEAILAEETIFKIKRSDQTDYSILSDVIDDTVSFEPVGGDTKEFTAISGKGLDVPTKIKFFQTTFPLWLTTDDIEVLRIALGEPTTTGTGPYTHTFNLETLSQQADIYIEGPKYGSTSEKVTFTGTGASVKFESLDIEKEGLMKYKCVVKVPAQNFDIAVVSDTDLS